MFPVRLTVSPRKLAANRANARRSTGPRTRAGKRRSALNALRHGLRAQPPQALSREALARLGEDPAEFERLRASLVEAWQPRNAQEALLVDDLAGLYWQRRREERSELELEARDFGNIAARRAECAQPQPDPNLPCEYSLTLEGYIGNLVVGSPVKFREGRAGLDTLLELAGRRDWGEEFERLVKKLYGEYARGRGEDFMALRDRLRQADPATPAALDDYARLLELLQNERDSVEECRERFERKQAEKQDTGRYDAEIATLRQRRSLRSVYQARFDQLIDSKIRLLAHLKSSRRPRAGRGTRATEQLNVARCRAAQPSTGARPAASGGPDRGKTQGQIQTNKPRKSRALNKRLPKANPREAQAKPRNLAVSTPRLEANPRASEQTRAPGPQDNTKEGSAKAG